MMDMQVLNLSKTVQNQAAATSDAQQTLKKLQKRVVTLERQHPEKAVEVWAEDETPLGLLPVHRRFWAKGGEDR